MKNKLFFATLLFSMLSLSSVLSFSSFETLNEAPYAGPFYGGLHSHTTYAMPNYAGTPLDAFKTARSYVLPGMDFNANEGTNLWGVTDYYWSLILHKQKWEKTLKQAEQIRAENFPAIVGWEWSIFQAGAPEQRDHINCFPVNQKNPPLPPTEGMTTLSGLYHYAADEKHFLVCQFNHPEMRSDAEPLPAFYEFRYDEDGDKTVSLIEIKGKGGGFRGYFQALNKGWHLSPVRNEDNKDWSWGLRFSRYGTQRRAGVFAKENTVDALMESLKNGITFATTDKSLSAWLTVDGGQKNLTEKYRNAAKTYFMGSVLYNVKTFELSLHAEDSDKKEITCLTYYPVVCKKRGCGPPEKEKLQTPQPDSPYFVSATLYTNGGTKAIGASTPLSGGTVVKTWTNLHTRAFKEKVVVNPEKDGTNKENATGSVWYVLRLVQSDGDEVITAPVYVHLK